jgi:hypothetical protein
MDVKVHPRSNIWLLWLLNSRIRNIIGTGVGANTYYDIININFRDDPGTL